MLEPCRVWHLGWRRVKGERSGLCWLLLSCQWLPWRGCVSHRTWQIVFLSVLISCSYITLELVWGDSLFNTLIPSNLVKFCVMCSEWVFTNSELFLCVPHPFFHFVLHINQHNQCCHAHTAHSLSVHLLLLLSLILQRKSSGGCVAPKRTNGLLNGV